MYNDWWWRKLAMCEGFILVGTLGVWIGITLTPDPIRWVARRSSMLSSRRPRPICNNMFTENRKGDVLIVNASHISIGWGDARIFCWFPCQNASNRLPICCLPPQCVEVWMARLSRLLSLFRLMTTRCDMIRGLEVVVKAVQWQKCMLACVACLWRGHQRQFEMHFGMLNHCQFDMHYWHEFVTTWCSRLGGLSIVVGDRLFHFVVIVLHWSCCCWGWFRGHFWQSCWGHFRDYFKDYFEGRSCMFS